MKLTNFRNLVHAGTSVLDYEYTATVTQNYNKLFFWKVPQDRKIKRLFGSNWFFTDTGEFTPSTQAEQLERAYNAKKPI